MKKLISLLAIVAGLALAGCNKSGNAPAENAGMAATNSMGTASTNATPAP